MLQCYSTDPASYIEDPPYMIPFTPVSDMPPPAADMCYNSYGTDEMSYMAAPPHMQHYHGQDMQYYLVEHMEVQHYLQGTCQYTTELQQCDDNSCRHLEMGAQREWR